MILYFSRVGIALFLTNKFLTKKNRRISAGILFHFMVKKRNPSKSTLEYSFQPFQCVFLTVLCLFMYSVALMIILGQFQVFKGIV